jgi:acyl carrier protein
MQNISEKVKDIVAKQLDIKLEKVKDDSRFIEDLGIDSLDTVALFVALEDEFGVEIPDVDKEKLLTVRESVEYIKKVSDQA